MDIVAIKYMQIVEHVQNTVIKTKTKSNVIYV